MMMMMMFIGTQTLGSVSCWRTSIYIILVCLPNLNPNLNFRLGQLLADLDLGFTCFYVMELGVNVFVYWWVS